LPVGGRMTCLWDEWSPRLCRTVHIAEAAAQVVEKARRADRPITVGVQCGGAAQLLRHAPGVPDQSGEGEVDDFHNTKIRERED